jgi:hypothetical protein
MYSVSHSVFFIPVVQQVNSGLGHFIFNVSRSHTIRRTRTHTHTHPLGPLWTLDQPVAEVATQQTQEKNIHAISGIRTRNRCRQAAAYRRIRALGPWNGTHWVFTFETRNGDVMCKRSGGESDCDRITVL